MTITNSNLSILLFASVAASSTITSLSYDVNPMYNPSIAGTYHVEKEISDRVNLFNSSEYYFYEEKEKIDVILDFAHRLIDKSKDIDNEFVEIVNEYFWDLI